MFRGAACRIQVEDQHMAKRVLALMASAGLLVVLVGPATARNINSINAYAVHNLQSDVPGAAAQTDPDLVNGWGIAAGPATGPATPWWVADNHTSKSTLYNGNTGAKLGLVVNVPGPDGPGAPTGVVFNGSSEFVISGGGGSSAARFIFDGEDGVVTAWNGGTAAVIAATSLNGAIYKGLAIGGVTTGTATANYLYAADFHNAHVDVYNGSFTLQNWAGAFVDPGIPAGFAPFGIQNIAGEIFVTYAKQDADAVDEIAGEGLGYVSAFGTDGSFHGRVASGGSLKAPWGLAWAPSNFGKFSNHLLVGNFGDGRINAFRPTDDGWEAHGKLKGTNNRPISIDGLWGIGFGNGGGAGPTNILYFAAGPDDENHGLFGSITAP
jgi:uncharacterized protein (TIGR03118 family)